MAEDFSLADISAMVGNNQGNNWFWIVILFLFMFGFGGGKAFGGTGSSDAATQADLQRSFDTNSIMNKLNSIGNGLADSGYANANLINGVNSNMQMGFANLTNAMAQNTAAVNASIVGLGNQLNECCCGLKSQMLQDKYEAAQSQLVQAQTIISNQTQTQTILNALGRYVANPPTPPVIPTVSSTYGGGTTL